MITIRYEMFETNSSSCNVLTVFTDEELEQIKNGLLVIWLPRYHNDDDEVYKTELLTQDAFIEIINKRLDFNEDICSNDTYMQICKEYWALATSVTTDASIDFEEEDNKLREKYVQNESVVLICSDVCERISRTRYELDHIIESADIYNIKGTKLYVSLWCMEC